VADATVMPVEGTMTKQVFQKFMAKVAQDAQLQREVEALAKDDKGVPASALAALAARKGFTFSVEDVSNELSEEELAGVAGGLLPAVNVALKYEGKVFPKVESFVKLDLLHKFLK
jgi:predicted ribosomally synthesized peptide with nif11-like leader